MSTQHLTLANGLNVALCHAPRLKRCAASLRVAAGSHDVPAAWPGLAHFLEHLFFLGTEAFAGDQKLMAFVQRHGGQINASTRERSTDFFFELPTAVFAQGLERLCDMLAHPRMALPDQLREREVLHAEFIAWSRDVTARQQLQWLEGISARHPLRGFHAGNRYTLPVPNKGFQQALQDFYQRFYQAGQMTLCLAGPQSLDQLKALATTYGASLASGTKIQQARPPKLVDHKPVMLIDTGSDRVNVLVACDDLPAGIEEATAFLCHCLNGSRAEGVVESFKTELIYQFSGQFLLRIEVTLCPVGARLAREAGASVLQKDRVIVLRGPASLQPKISSSALIQSWLTHFKTHWPSLRDNYNRLQQRRLEVSGPLELAHDSARNIPQGLSDLGCETLVVLLAHMQAGAQTPTENIDWQLPKANPFLSATGNGREGAIYLRWQLPTPQPALWRMFEHSLKALGADARQAGVELEWSAYGDCWQLKLTGLDASIPEVLQHALRLLSDPDHRGQPEPEPALIPIRQLIKALPDALLNTAPSGEIKDVQALWQATRWISLTSGLTLNTMPKSVPGTPVEHSLQAPALASGKHWRTAASPSSESAVLLFCPVPESSIVNEAAWRLLAQLAQGPFYQRLRVELQLGYAVFSGLRSIAGQVGLVFGVQSPSATVQQLVGHIERFVEHLSSQVADADLVIEAANLVAQLDINAMEPAQAAELNWQAHLAGRDERYLATLNETLRNLDRHTLLQAVANLQCATGGWLCLTNSLENPWQST